ncbi:TetR/AcrR family transcriptional regulator [Kribbella shirazensis]|uniref:AcrR family transcriptional regulator n=1 Tax=Kribbella shirazensis TaxID=1105143 RepID=A0A7X5VD74_9ACTN|nr:TetR/AcrR family transcriptional regulator [Kribbella shirazensis]NIK59038.1 AcrR family transcriptional regulator [Kribbella shirazensis]
MPPRRTQAERIELTRNKLLESAARGFSTYGYGNVRLDDIARDAGYTRGALYHLFANKEELALAVIDWVSRTWDAEVGEPAKDVPDPAERLLWTAQAHAKYVRRDVAAVLMSLRVEFAGRDHPVAQALTDLMEPLKDDVAKLITRGRRLGSIPAGPPPRALASAYLGVVEGVTAAVGGPPHDVELTLRAARGVLGLPIPSPRG